MQKCEMFRLFKNRTRENCFSNWKRSKNETKHGNVYIFLLDEFVQFRKKYPTDNIHEHEHTFFLPHAIILYITGSFEIWPI